MAQSGWSLSLDVCSARLLAWAASWGRDAELTPEAVARQLADEKLWQALLAASKVDSAIEQAVTSGEPAHVARYAFQLAQAYSNFYQEFPVLIEANAEKKTFLLWLTEYFRAQLERTLGVLGIEVPEYM